MGEHRRKLNDIKREAYLAEIRKGVRLVQAAKNIGLSYDTIWNATKTDAAFAKAIAEAEIAACEPIENALWNKAVSGNVTAMIFWLQNRAADRWQDRRATSKVEITTPLSTDQLESVREELLKKLNDVTIT